MRDKRAIVAVALVVAAVLAGVITSVARGGGQASPTTDAVAATVTTTVTVTMHAPVPLSTQWAEDSLPRELETWVWRTGADLWGPGRADVLAPGHAGCWAGVTRTVTRVMCPDGHRAVRVRATT